MSLLALFVSFFPPSSIPASEDRTYQVILLISFIVTLLLPFILYELHDKRGKEAQIDEPVHMKTGDVNPATYPSARGEHHIVQNEKYTIKH